MPLAVKDKADLDDVQVVLAERSLRKYVDQAWPLVEPGRPFVPGYHIDAICEHLEAVSSGQIRRLIINIPPRSGKSLLVSVFWPTWDWARHPEIRWLYSAYALSLAVRDSLKCRRIIGSPWYQSRWGEVYQLTGDQNVKSVYENNKTGYRLCASVEAGVTGQGGDRLVCLWYDTLIITDGGPVRIGDIVESKMPVSVRSYDEAAGALSWERVEAYESNPGRPSVRITFSNGRTLEATDDHPIYVIDRGYVPAADVAEGDEALSLEGDLSGMRGRNRAGAQACLASEARSLLQSRLPRHLGTGKEQPCLAGRANNAGLRSMQNPVSGQTPVTSQEIPPQVLFKKVPEFCHAGSECLPMASHSNALRLLRGGDFQVTEPHIPQELLLTALCEPGSPRACTREGEWEIPARIVFRAILSGFQGCLADYPGQGWSSLSALRDESLRTGQRAGCPSCQLRQGGRCSAQSHLAMSVVSRVNAWQQTQPSEMDAVLVTKVEKIGRPERVYNLRLRHSHNYFANGILVHNCDDPHDTNQAESEPIRKATIDWWDGTMTTRFNDLETGQAVIIGQRVHEEDLTGHLLAQGGWEHLCLPGEYEPKRQCVVRSTGWKDWRKEEGELLWPDKVGPRAIEALRKALGEYRFAGQIQQRPSPAEGGQIKRSWWQFYRERPKLESFDEIIQSWDMAFKRTRDSDYVVGQVWGRIGANKYLLAEDRARRNFPETIKAVLSMSAAWPQTYAKLVEDKANGPAVIDTLRQRVEGLIAVNPEGGKEARVAAVSPQIQAGNVYLPDPSTASWVDAFIDECASFPTGAHDDRVDCMSQALLRMAAPLEIIEDMLVTIG